MKYIDAITGSFIALIIFVIAAYYVPGTGPSNEIELVLTISTFLFAILAGFFIARLNTRYDNICDCVAREDALWLSLYIISSGISKAFQTKISSLIDEYYIVAYDFELGLYYKYNAHTFQKIFQTICELKVDKSPKQAEIMGNGMVLMENIEQARNTSSVLSIQKLTKGQWGVMLLLSFIITFSIFAIKTETIFSQLSAILLSTILVLVLLLIRDLQNLRLGGKAMLDESGAEVLEFMGKLRYYNKRYLDEGITNIPDFVKKYRVGLHNPGEKPRVKIINK